MPSTHRTVFSATAALLGLVASACGGGGETAATTTVTSTTSTTGSTITTSTGSTTAGVLCSFSQSVVNSSPYVNTTATVSWSCSGTQRTLLSNGLPDHAVGAFPNANNPNAIAAQSINISYTLNPALAGSSSAVQVNGYALNGIKFEPGTNGWCNDSGGNCSLNGQVGSWHIEALGQSAFNFGVDDNLAHVQPGGLYHYHGLPAGLIARLGKGQAMTLVGWAADGYPMYARYGYTDANNAGSPVKLLSPSWRRKASPDAGRPALALYAMGTFTQDWEYAAASGDLDECNGRSGVTPEFPQGIYHYLVTDAFPFMGRCLKGTAAR